MVAVIRSAQVRAVRCSASFKKQDAGCSVCVSEAVDQQGSSGTGFDRKYASVKKNEAKEKKVVHMGEKLKTEKHTANNDEIV